MFSNTFLLIAQAAGQAAPAQNGFLNIYTMIPVMLIIMYFIVIRPQRNEEKKRKAMIESLQKGDVVITSSGIHGKVVEFKDNNETVVLAIAKDTNVSFSTSTILKKKDKEKEG
ncbi:preprotein translocase subunit YajC [Leptospira wolffii]|uniref:Sec translocon accessory complex subunit YajC n=1 Tax=Leptospira wolffii TaxID=409998 RepID=A0A2M9ZCM9_9LEPT|nr:preprotein translocase, YajC subunit [Leptospira wolffii serovar Khorat str. Khorat-H2]PJZ66186.1 preprotein translocase subunit YajC [Leptospira wolffii]TGK60260.1 preprotein translocase subunit YajC [Leptospira wolffii]TGK72602.1 preprotein translocase subunit YajC [Leptospira wolffii]TGK76267.1 preprotein translocase subunit YajC [Leptospira wolffii]